MLAMHMSVSLCQGGHHHIIHSQIIHAHRHTDDIHNGLNGSHFVEMHLFQRQTMGLGLCLGHDPEHPAC